MKTTFGSRWLRAGAVVSVAALGLTLVSCSKKKSDPAASAGAAPTAQAPEGAPAGAASSAAPSAQPGAFGSGVIRGTVALTGKAPEAKAITTPDPFCGRHGIKEQEILVDGKGGLKNVLVRLTTGVSGTYPPPSAEAVLDQAGCLYSPRVQAVIAGQTLQIKNSDQTLHNVHTYKGASTVFNQAQLPGMGPITKKLSDAGAIMRFRCDVHPWMTGYVAVLSHPFFAVSNADGSFTIEKVPAGSYTLEAWHERLGTRTAEVKVTDGAPAEVKLAFTVP